MGGGCSGSRNGARLMAGGGLVLSVQLEGEQREALLELPMPKFGNGSAHRRRPMINKAVVANGVCAALAAGWEPIARGKLETYMVDANGC